MAVGARVSDIYLGLAPKPGLENILMLSLTDGHFRGDPPRANAVLLAGIYDFFGLKYAPVSCTGTRNYVLSESLKYSASDSESLWALAGG